VLRLKPDGRLLEVFNEILQEGTHQDEGNRSFTYSNVNGISTPDLSEIGFDGNEISNEKDTETTVSFQRRWHFDSKIQRYVSIPSVQASSPRRKYRSGKK
jgi:hypothetical protein